MPTPFQHLVYAERVLAHPGLPPALRDLLEAERPAYLLGNTAVDVQTLTGQPRMETHFYRLRDPLPERAIPTMLATHPVLADPRALPPAQAAFLSGYLVHLAWDELWACHVFAPFYMDAAHWSDRLTYVLHHNALRVRLDRRALERLERESVAYLLAQAQPDHWLPFVPPPALHRWRDWLVAQLTSPQRVETLQVFADRMNVPQARLAEVVQEMEEGCYTAAPGLEEALGWYDAVAPQDAVSALAAYWRERGDVPVSPVMAAACALC